MTQSRIDQAWWALRITYGLVAFLAGLDKFLHLLADWDRYLSPTVASLLPVSGSTFMQAVGVVEMAVGILILSRWTRVGAFVASAWLLTIAANLLLVGAFDVAVRDVAMAVGAWTLAQLSDSRALADSPSTAAVARAQA
jgi:hypothetical protein